MLLTTLLLNVALAAQPVLKLDGKPLELVEIKAKHLLLSKKCKKADGMLACDAIRAANRASYSKAAAGGKLADGANPGAVVCESLNGDVTLAADDQGNEQSFCRFADGTMIDSGSLQYHALANDEKQVQGSPR